MKCVSHCKCAKNRFLAPSMLPFFVTIFFKNDDLSTPTWDQKIQKAATLLENIDMFVYLTLPGPTWPYLGSILGPTWPYLGS